jgi:hypothetical protein
MKKHFLYLPLAILFVLLISNSCRKALKNPDDYLPKAKIVSTEILSDGRVLVRGEIESKGYSDVEYAGFCCGTSGEPNIISRQMIAELDGNEFVAVYTGFDVDSTYYFRCWATNDQGYKYGNIVSLGNIIAPAVVPACTLPMNKLDDGAGWGTKNYYSVYVPTNSWQYWEFSANPQSGNSLHFKFGSAITTGIYTTENDFNPSSGKVFVYFGQFSLESGTKVYVNTIGADTFDITICNAPWKFSATTTLTLNTRFQCPL